MRVLHLIARYWPYTGGSERHLQELSERLARDGHQVTVYTTDAWDLEHFWAAGKGRVEENTAEHNGVRIRRFGVQRLPLARWSFPGIRRLMSTLSALPIDSTFLLFPLARLAPRVPALERALRQEQERYDLVMGMNICFESLLYPAWRFARRTGAAFVVQPLIHLGEPQNDRVRRYYTMRHQIRLIAQSDAVLAQTELERDYLIRRGVAAAKVFGAPPGVNPPEVWGGHAARFRQKYALPPGPIVFSVGTTAYDKGTIHLVEAMRRLWAQGLEATLILAGPTMEHFLRYYEAQPEEVRGRCRVLGFIPEEDKRDLLAAGDVFALPSRTDSFGIVYLEAWLYRQPVVGAWAGGVPEVIEDGVDGFLVPFGDVGALAQRLAQLLTDRALAQAMGEKGYQKVLRHHTWDRTYVTVKEVYERLCPPKRTTLLNFGVQRWMLRG